MKLVQSSSTAVIVLDVQNDFCDSNGGFAKNLGWDPSSIQQMVPKLATFIDRARNSGATIIFSQMVNGKKDSPENLQEHLKSHAESAAGDWPFALERGTWGYDFFQLKPEAGDLVMEKKYYDLFSNSELNRILKQKKISTLIITGLYTEVCVFGTAERAFTEGYRVVVPRDLVGSVAERENLRVATLDIMGNYLADVVESSELF